MLNTVSPASRSNRKQSQISREVSSKVAGLGEKSSHFLNLGLGVKILLIFLSGGGRGPRAAVHAIELVPQVGRFEVHKIQMQGAPSQTPTAELAALLYSKTVRKEGTRRK